MPIFMFGKEGSFVVMRLEEVRPLVPVLIRERIALIHPVRLL
jgi:hypothetical protein